MPTKFFWAYCAAKKQVVLVRFNNRQDAAEESQRMKFSDATTVGFTVGKLTQEEAIAAMKKRGWEIQKIR